MNNLTYKIIAALTLILPTSAYLFINAVLFNITPDVIIYANTIDLIVEPYEDMYFISNALETQYDGLTIYHNNMIGVLVDENDVIKTDDGYVQLEDMQLIEIERSLIKKEQSYQLPLSIMIMLFGVLLATLVVMGKMNLISKYPRLSALVSLAVGTGVLAIIDVIVSNLLYVFLIATVSWGVYCIEYLYHKGTLTKTKAEKVESDLVASLRTALDKIK